MNVTKTENILTDKGVVRRRIEERLVAVNEDLIQRLADQSPRSCRLGVLMDLESTLAIYKDCVALSFRIDKIPLKTKFTPGDDFLYPSFAENGLLMYKEWVIPTDMEAYLTCVSFGESLKVILSAWSSKEKQMYRLPLPNIYEDGSICMGDRFNYDGSDLLASARRSIKSFKEAEWNRDLIHNTGGNHVKMFRYDPDGNQLAPLQAWESLSFPLGVRELSHLNKV